MKSRAKANQTIITTGSSIRQPPILIILCWLWPLISFWALRSTPADFHPCQLILGTSHLVLRAHQLSGGSSWLLLASSSVWRVGPHRQCHNVLRTQHEPQPHASTFSSFPSSSPGSSWLPLAPPGSSSSCLRLFPGPTSHPAILS